jgi:CheY-like chemotaxis protein
MKKIIFAEDDPSIRDVVKLILEKEGYDIQTLDNGSTLLANSYELPDLYILDKRMSGVDGMDICKYLKSQPSTAHIPVIMLSASPDIFRQAKEGCADGALEKPFKMQDLKDIVAKFLK